MIIISLFCLSNKVFGAPKTYVYKKIHNRSYSLNPLCPKICFELANISKTQGSTIRGFIVLDSKMCTTAKNVQNMKPVQICTGFIFCTFSAICPQSISGCAILEH